MFKQSLLFFLVSALTLSAQTGRSARALITERPNDARLHTLAGNTRPEATAANDQGRVADDLVMEDMLLQMKRPAELEQAAQQFVEDLHNPQSPSYHKWLTAAQFGETYGPSAGDVQTVTAWLQSHGFTVNSVSPSRMSVDFSGTAKQVLTAFHTEIHHLSVNGQRHVANMSDPQIPEALAPAVSGVVSMHDFKPRTMKAKHANYTFSAQGSAVQAVTPQDLATIYNLNPLLSNGITGQGQTIAVVEDSDIYNPGDWSTFRTAFGLAQYSSGSLTTVHPGNCTAPGVIRGGDDGEAILDAEWASASAPGAAIQIASCANTRSTDGLSLALTNLVNGSSPPSIISISFGNCEAENGAAANAAFSALYQQAVAEGISVFVAAGDEGAASCDAGSAAATHGIGVSGWASTPYNVAVGGTDFADSYQGTNSMYWNTANSSTWGSAISYVPEMAWNDSCASGILAGYFGYSTGYGTSGFCATSTATQDNLVNVAAGSGGPSNCATGAPDRYGVSNGTCQGFAKPSWQSVAGNPADGVRDIPDVSLFAGDGVWGHYYVTCWSNTRDGGSPCTGDPSNWSGAGGTSFAAPIMAGIQALVNQKTGSAQGNPNYVYYSLAASQYGSNASACNSSNGATVAQNCIFYNVTQGDIAVNCTGTQNCFGAGAASGFGGGPGRFGGNTTQGALSVSTDAYSAAYSTASGWNFATGIGSVNAANLVNNWPGH